MSQATKPETRLPYPTQYPPVLPPKIMRCFNPQCPVETFKGITIMPLNSCPACQNTGSPVAEQ